MTEPTSSEVEVVQEDREAAADHVFMALTPEWMSGPAECVVEQVLNIREGRADENSLVQAFAKHRLNTRASDEVERDRDEWKQQHENLLAIRQRELALLHERTEMLRRALAYLPSTLGITREIWAALPPANFDLAEAFASAALTPTVEGNG